MSINVNILPFPIESVPTWAVVNADDLLSLPLMGQFKPDVKRDHGQAKWAKRDGLLGGAPWLRFVGKGNETLKFTFHGIANSILDLYPSAAWERLQELATYDTTLGRPPKVYFVYGLTIVEGFITSVPEAPIDCWFNTRTPREIGPVEIEITLIPMDEVVISLSTNYVVMTEDTTYEQLAKTQYDDARFAASLAEYNQGKVVGDVIEVPRKGNPAIVRVTELSSYFGDDAIEGLS